MFERLTTAEKIAAAIAAGVGLVLFARRNSHGGSARVGFDPGLPDEHRHIVSLALEHEQDPAILHSLSSKLRAAGHRRTAEMTGRRAEEVRGAFFASGGASADARVLRAQMQLHALGWGIPVDGLLGADTRRAISEFQSLHGLGMDGILGPETLHALEMGAGDVRA